MMKKMLNEWKQYLREEEEDWKPSGEEMMFPAKFLFSHMGEYRTEQRWKDFAKLSGEEKMKWARSVKLDEPVEITVFSDGTFGHGDGHHRVMAAKILDVEIPIVISRNKLKDRDPELWTVWLNSVRQGKHPKELNPEGYIVRSLEQFRRMEKER
jgi:hypothetical protein